MNNRRASTKASLVRLWIFSYEEKEEGLGGRLSSSLRRGGWSGAPARKPMSPNGVSCFCPQSPSARTRTRCGRRARLHRLPSAVRFGPAVPLKAALRPGGHSQVTVRGLPVVVTAPLRDGDGPGAPAREATCPSLRRSRCGSAPCLPLHLHPAITAFHMPARLCS